MKFYYLLDNIDDDQKTGIYGRRVPTEDEKKDLTFNELLSVFDFNDVNDAPLTWQNVMAYSNVYTASLGLIKKGYDNYKSLKNRKPLFLAKPIDEKIIVIPNKLLEGDYKIGVDISILQGAFSKFPNPENAFKTLMSSHPNSTLIIAERTSIDKKHHGGEKGYFNIGLYCEHPKDKNVLLPLDQSNKLIESLILEEIITAYEALGAKRIEISDELDFSSNQNAGGIFKGIKLKINGNQEYKKEHLRTEVYGKGVFDSDRAMKNKKFIYDLSMVMSTINARIHGNQIHKTFSEEVDLSGGINADVLKMFNGGISFKYKRKWRFDVEFYDKTEM